MHFRPSDASTSRSYRACNCLTCTCNNRLYEPTGKHHQCCNVLSYIELTTCLGKRGRTAFLAFVLLLPCPGRFSFFLCHYLSFLNRSSPFLFRCLLSASTSRPTSIYSGATHRLATCHSTGLWASTFAAVAIRTAILCLVLVFSFRVLAFGLTFVPTFPLAFSLSFSCCFLGVCIRTVPLSVSAACTRSGTLLTDALHRGTMPDIP